MTNGNSTILVVTKKKEFGWPRSSLSLLEIVDAVNFVSHGARWLEIECKSLSLLFQWTCRHFMTGQGLTKWPIKIKCSLNPPISLTINLRESNMCFQCHKYSNLIVCLQCDGVVLLAIETHKWSLQHLIARKLAINWAFLYLVVNLVLMAFQFQILNNAIITPHECLEGREGIW